MKILALTESLHAFLHSSTRLSHDFMMMIIKTKKRFECKHTAIAPRIVFTSTLTVMSVVSAFNGDDNKNIYTSQECFFLPLSSFPHHIVHAARSQ